MGQKKVGIKRDEKQIQRYRKSDRRDGEGKGKEKVKAHAPSLEAEWRRRIWA